MAWPGMLFQVPCECAKVKKKKLKILIWFTCVKNINWIHIGTEFSYYSNIVVWFQRLDFIYFLKNYRYWKSTLFIYDFFWNTFIDKAVLCETSRNKTVMVKIKSYRNQYFYPMQWSLLNIQRILTIPKVVPRY